MRLRALALSLILVLPAAASAAPELSMPEGHPVEGRAVTLRLADDGRPAPGLAVTAVYRENAHAAIRHEQAVGTTGADGSVSWTPESAGVVVLQWDGGSRNVSVLHGKTPAGGVLIALLAGLALLGGSVLFFIQMLRQPESEIVEETEAIGEPPST